MSDIGSMERRDDELRQEVSLAPTVAERDRRELLGVVKRLKGAMREALVYLEAEKPDPESAEASAIDALRYALEQD